jgi:CheY-like chemotaxis protein
MEGGELRLCRQTARMQPLFDELDRLGTLPEGDTNYGSPTEPDRLRSSATILVVDDERDVVDVLEAALRAEGYRVVTACNGADAIDRATALHPDVVVTDLLMPVVDGIALAKRLRADPSTRSIRIVLSSGVAEGSVRAMFKDFDAFLQKPYGLEDLRHVVAMLLES